DDLPDEPLERGVVDCMRQVVALGGAGEVRVDHDVHLEWLRLDLLMRQDAAVPSTRSSGPVPPSSSPMNRLRLVPSKRGSPPSALLNSARRWRSSRFSAVPLPKPMPG